ncbi:FxSxx-COOH system tetratricopeptide repeat protein [Lentzea rhizosphaerae]|uniref:FxSxx-COOH system tetratricopeptide repeat protein n=1 Tax=Lentzea rhizosphaerae TaxID=2041025 RepID=A0ABV8C021_9PSEU
MPEPEYEFDLALSFAGEDRPYVEEVARLLTDAGLRIFYDVQETAELWGRELTEYLDEIYRRRSRFVVIFASAFYAQSSWTSFERRSVLARSFSTSSQFVLPIRLDDTEIPGWPPSIGYLDGRTLTPRQVAQLLIQKVVGDDQEPEASPTPPPRLPSPPWKVFLSHTSELRAWPARKSFIDAAESAIKRAGHAPRDMAYFTAHDQPPAQVCAEAVADCNVYVLVAGFRYGSPVVDRPEVSYTELEFETAGNSSIERLVFLLGEGTEGTVQTLTDLEHGKRQLAFRERLGRSGLTCVTIENPDELETQILQALTVLATTAQQTGHRRAASNIPAGSRTFVGRADLLNRMSLSLPAGRSAVLALHGMGGVGKSTVAVEYAHRNITDYDTVWRVPADDPVVITDRLAELAHALQFAEPDVGGRVAVARLFGQLRRLDRWLIIFDNATNPEALAEFLPRGPGHVVITSRNPNWDSLGSTIEVSELTRDEAVQLLRRPKSSLSTRDAGRIAEAVGDLPLALEQAAVALNGYGLIADTYLTLLRDPARNVLGTELAGHRGSVAASFKVTFDQLSRRSPAAMQLATLIAWLAPEPVPLDLFTRNSYTLPLPLASAAGDQFLFAALLAQLREQSLVQIRQETLQMHQILAVLLRANDFFPPTDDHSYGWRGVAVLLLRSALTSNPDGEPGWPLWRQLLPHVLAVAEATASLPGLAPEAAWLTASADAYLRSSDA